jgi:hypothetical protein
MPLPRIISNESSCEVTRAVSVHLSSTRLNAGIAALEIMNGMKDMCVWRILTRSENVASKAPQTMTNYDSSLHYSFSLRSGRSSQPLIALGHCHPSENIPSNKVIDPCRSSESIHAYLAPSREHPPLSSSREHPSLSSFRESQVRPRIHSKMKSARLASAVHLR